MTQPTDPFTLPYEAAESITVACLKRKLAWMNDELAWMEEERAKSPLFEQDKAELIKDIEAIRRVLWWLTGDVSYDDSTD